ncbi:SDR family NAD(P)-dependent oxidoreductase [Mycobacterium paraseoulense]|uniref:SDR family NAD(P)-dependent oxidoreductase n=1 Tax=Mycobacterium TaxID=1763 RepID=UPI0027B93CE8|nr:SDR family NAD(P)-dependent oxidoreductase [Mycobacterium paraseoulense]
MVVGAAAGIGKASALLLAEAGAKVIAADRDRSRAEPVAAAVTEEGGMPRLRGSTSPRSRRSAICFRGSRVSTSW